MIHLNLSISAEPNSRGQQAVSISLSKGFLDNRLAEVDPGDIIEQFVEFLDQTGIELSTTVRTALIDCALAAGSSEAGRAVLERLEMYQESL